MASEEEDEEEEETEEHMRKPHAESNQISFVFLTLIPYFTCSKCD
jgi:hypothetical protein